MKIQYSDQNKNLLGRKLWSGKDNEVPLGSREHNWLYQHDLSSHLWSQMTLMLGKLTNKLIFY